MTAAIKPAQIRFLSMYRGEAHFEVLDGPMKGSRASVRSLSSDFYRMDWDGGGPWNMTESAYIRDIVGAAGIVNIRGEAVPIEVLVAVDAEFVENRVQSAHGSHGTFCTGSWSAEAGWTKSEFDAQGAPTAPQAAPQVERMRA